MKMTYFDIIEGREHAKAIPEGCVITIGEGRDEIDIQIDNYGRLAVRSVNGPVVIKPQASNAFLIETEKR